MKFRRIVLVVSLFCLVGASNSFAFDGVRKGFVFGGGLGAGYVNVERTEKFSDGTQNSKSFGKGSIMFRFDVGYVPKDVVQLAWSSTVFVVLEKASDDVTRNALEGFSGLTATRYLSTDAPGFSATLGIGMVFDSDMLNLSSHQSQMGFGLLARTNYEFSPHLQLGLDLIYGWPKQSERDVTVFGAGISLSWLGY